MVNVKKLGYISGIKRIGTPALAAGTQDMVEAFMAFREKRLPTFTGL